jgi:RNA polymerase sigma-70 factor (ECF subfamily)
MLRRLLRSAGEPKSVTDTADRFRTADSAPTTATFASDAESQAWTPPTWEEIVSTHSGRVYRLAYRLTGNQHDAEDLTQEVFVRVFRSLSTYTPGTFEGWLHRITTNLFLDMVRRKQRIRFDALADDAAERLPSRSPRRSRSSTTRTSTPTCSRPSTPSRPSSVPRSSSATSKDCRTRRSPRPSA